MGENFGFAIMPRTRLFLALLSFLQWGLNGVARRLLHELRPRTFSNRVLEKSLASLSGDIINVSGWKDSDKEGRCYREYYASYERYVLSNVEGEGGMPDVLPEDVEGIYLDLNGPVSEDLQHQFDVVFCHTVLEHVFDLAGALESLAVLTRDVVVIIVPFAQSVHYSSSYSDYHRFSPPLLREFYEQRGFTVLLSTDNSQPFFPTYTVFIASRFPEKHKSAFSGAPTEYDAQIAPGRWGRYRRTGLATLYDPSRTSGER